MFFFTSYRVTCKHVIIKKKLINLLKAAWIIRIDILKDLLNIKSILIKNKNKKFNFIE